MQVLTLLRPQALTVNELAEALHLTDNGVRAQLATLQVEGLVELCGQRAGVRKPHQLFGLTSGGHDLFPKPDSILLEQLLNSIEARLGEPATTDFLRQVGVQLAIPHAPATEDLPFQDRLNIALGVLGAIGGIAQATEREGVTVIQGQRCPLTRLVPKHPEVCAVAQGLLEKLLQRPVTERCTKQPHAKCCFEIAPPAAN
jgi:predicted ArsR family transcriptional regulator